VSTITWNEDIKGNAKCKNFHFELPYGGLRGNVHSSSMARWKARGRLSIVLIEHFSLALMVETLWADIGRNRCSKGGGSLWAQISRGTGRRPPTTVGVRKLDSLGYRTALFSTLRDPMFTRFGTIPACYRQTHRRTDGQWTHDDRQLVPR